MDGEIADVLNKINNRIFLPGLQREFVWKPHQIESFFDSLMRGYPVGIITIWKTSSGAVTEYTNYEFLKSYAASTYRVPYQIRDEYIKYNELADEGDAEFLVIDGQQRMNSLYIGVLGEIATYSGGQGRDSKEPSNWNEKVLCVDLFGHPNYDKDIIAGEYQFQFRSTGDLGGENKIGYEQVGEEHHLWIPVGEFWISDDESDSGYTINDSEGDEIVSERIDSAPIPSDVINSQSLQKCAWGVGREVRTNILEGQLETKNIKQDREEIPEIFQRLNRKGEQPKPYQLLMSQMMSYWPYRADNPTNPREEISSWVDQFQELFPEYEEMIQRSLFIRYSAYLMNIDLLLSSLENISEKDLDLLHQKWTYNEPMNDSTGDFDWFVESLKKSFRTIIDTGIRPELLNTMPVFVLLALFYYENPDAKVDAENKNAFFRFISKAKLLDQSGYQSIGYGKCRNYRRYLFNQASGSSKSTFPGDELLDNEGLTLSRAAIKEAVKNSRYDGGDNNDSFTDGDVISVLGLIEESYASATTNISDCHIDHIYPKGKSDQIQEAAGQEVDLDRIGNLQLLPKTHNEQKGSDLPKQWLQRQPSVAANVERMNLYPDVELDPENAVEFIEKREDKIIKYLIDNYVDQAEL